MNISTKRRTIMIFPIFENIKKIDELREKYDPLSKHVRPHITLVFTFESNLTSFELRDHLIDVISGTIPFNLSMKNIIKIDNPLGMYLFLDVKDGNENIKELSEKLYTGILAPFKPNWLNKSTFSPHMTIGNFTSKEDLNKAFEDASLLKESFHTVVNKISVEIIDENENSIIEMELDLQ